MACLIEMATVPLCGKLTSHAAVLTFIVQFNGLLLAVAVSETDRDEMGSDREPTSITPLTSDRGPVVPRQRLLDVSQAAEFLAVTVSTLYGWVWQRKISFVKLGRALRFDVADLERFVDQNRVRPRRNGQP